MEQQRRTLESKGLRIAVITYDPRPVLAHFAARRNIGFPLLSDPDSAAIRAFGILNESAGKDSPAYGVPYPGTFLISANGVIRSKYFEPDYRERFPAGTVLLREFGAVLGKRTTVRTTRLAVTTSASTDSVFLGHRLTLTADIELPKRMHVYAPGVAGYKPLEWEMKPSAQAQAAAVSFPPARGLRLKAIGETAPVYANRIRLTRDLTIATGAAAREAMKSGVIEVEGVLRFQACDDKQCYLPESLPLKWTFQMQKPDAERVPPELRGKVK